MDKIKITGGIALKGEVQISGAKNAALPLMAACLLTDQTLKLYNVPHLVDTSTMSNLLINHGVKFNLDGSDKNGGHFGEVISLQADNINNLEAPYDIVRKMRASVLVLGPLLARFGKAKVSLPGGCAIGSRPIDLHLKAFEHMGAKIVLEDGYVSASVKGRLKGCDIQFDKVSVGATENVLMAACLADGTTVIGNAAREPEVTDLAHCLIKMGADIEGIGTDTLTIKGKEILLGASHSVIADRIEAISYLIAAAITKGQILVKGCPANLISSVIEKLIDAGISIEQTETGILAKRAADKVQSVDIKTQPYPAFPTDAQAQLMTLMTIADGSSVITENIFENRFMHASELRRMGADIKIEGRTAVVTGIKQLKGANIMATDLRASISLVLAGLAAKGDTVISRVYHIDRGYERLEEKLGNLGAKIERLRD